MRRSVFALVALLALVLLAPRTFAQCATIQHESGGPMMNVYAGVPNVVITPGTNNPTNFPLPPALVNTALPGAAAWWQNECPSAQFPNIPRYSGATMLLHGQHRLNS